MIDKSRLAALALMAATGLATAIAAMGAAPAFAQSIYSPSETGGGSWGYNHHMAIDQWRLRHKHHASPHAAEHLPGKTQ